MLMSPLKRWISRNCRYASWEIIDKLQEQGHYRKLVNYVLAEYCMSKGFSWNLGRPYWLTIDPMNFCQLQCPFCPTGSGRGVRSKGRMDIGHYKKFMDKLGPCVIFMDLINWGEPLLYKDLPEMIRYAKKFGIKTKIDTNLNDLTEEMARGIVKSGLDIMQLSIDGVTQATYERYRVNGDLEKVLRNLRLLARVRKELGSRTPRLIWKFIVFKHNEHEIEAVKTLADEYGADQVNYARAFIPQDAEHLRDWLPQDPVFQRYEPPPQSAGSAASSVMIETLPVQEAYHAMRFKPGHLYKPSALLNIVLRSAGFSDFFRRLSGSYQAYKESRGGSPSGGPAADEDPGERTICKWPWAGMTINPDRSVAPCCSIEDQADDFGLLNSNLGRLWNGAMYRRSRKHVRSWLAGKARTDPRSDHVCERCTMIGRANFVFPGKNL